MKRRNINKKDNISNAGDKATCDETAQEKGQTMGEKMDKGGRIDKEKTQEQL